MIRLISNEALRNEAMMTFGGYAEADRRLDAEYAKQTAHMNASLVTPESIEATLGEFWRARGISKARDWRLACSVHWQERAINYTRALNYRR